MSSLFEIQRRFGDAIRSGTALTTPGAEDTQEHLAFAAASVTDGARLSAVEQLDVYREQFWFRHLASLQEDFVAVEHLLGKERFQVLVRAYLDEHPPRHFSLQRLGDAMPEFVRSAAPWSNDPFLVDLVAVEQAFVFLFDAPDARPFDPAMLANVPEAAWPLSTIRLSPAFRILHLGSEAHLYRAAARTGENAEVPERKPTHLAVARGKTALEYMVLGEPQSLLLEKLRAGMPLGEACEHTQRELSIDAADFEAQLGGWFQGWTAWGWLVGIDPPR